MNVYLIGAAILVFLILGVVGYRYFKKPATATLAISPDELSLIASSLKAHAEGIAATAKADVEKAASIVRSKLHPAAPAASVAATPPAVAPSEPSAGSGGTVPVQVVVTASDAVLAKHAQLDAVIADHQTAIATHQAAIVDVQNQKAAVTAAQDALNKLVA